MSFRLVVSELVVGSGEQLLWTSKNSLTYDNLLNYFQNLKKEVRSALDSLISGNKAKQLQTTKDVSKHYFKKLVVQTWK